MQGRQVLPQRQERHVAAGPRAAQAGREQQRKEASAAAAHQRQGRASWLREAGARDVAFRERAVPPAAQAPPSQVLLVMVRASVPVRVAAP